MIERILTWSGALAVSFTLFALPATAQDPAAVEGQADAAAVEEAPSSEPTQEEKDRLDGVAGPPAGRERPDFKAVFIERRARQFTHKVNSRINRYLAAAMEQSEEQSPEVGLALIRRLNPKRLNPMERAKVFQIEGLLHYGSGNLEKTIESFNKSIAEEILPLDQEVKLRFNVAQLLAGLYKWDDAIAAIYEWFHWTQEEDALAYYLLGIANYQLGNFDLAIVNTIEALEVAKEPKESWLQLLAALWVQRNNYVKAAPVFEDLITLFPKKNYWVQLGLIYGALEKYDASLSIQQIAYEQGLLTEDKELQRLARSFLYADLPYPAAKVLQKGIDEGAIEADPDALQLLANSWIASREFERSLPPLLRAAEISEDGNLFVRLGQVHLQREEWGDAAKHFEKAIDKGGLEKPGSAHLLLGIAYYNDAQSFRAKSTFVKAARFDSAREQAEQWIDHLEKEANSTS
ncbi:MAG: hypothetical protein QF570_03320 [Myxococcota bacterium]|jgi:hypothetical protein|nr:hypothetical protein [Myxococcota bacterium]